MRCEGWGEDAGGVAAVGRGMNHVDGARFPSFPLLENSSRLRVCIPNAIAFGALPRKARTCLSSRPCWAQRPRCVPASTRLVLLFTLSIVLALNAEGVQSCDLRTRGGGGGGGRTPGEEQPLALPARLLCQWAWLNSCHPSLHFPGPILPCSALGRPGSSEILLGYEPPATGALGQLQTLLQTPRSLPCRAAYGPGI